MIGLAVLLILTGVVAWWLPEIVEFFKGGHGEQ